MAVDTLLDRGGQLATLPEDINNLLSSILPTSWSHSNPIDVVGDADKVRYVKTINAILDSDCADALLIMHSPSAVSDSVEAAEAIIAAIKAHPRHKRFNILTNWSGEQTAKPLDYFLLRQASQLIERQKVPWSHSCTSSNIAETRSN